MVADVFEVPPRGEVARRALFPRRVMRLLTRRGVVGDVREGQALRRKSNFRPARVFERALEKALGPLLHETVNNPEAWNDRWSDSEGRLHIVGDANIGEIRFSWARKEVSQSLWWYQPSSAARPTPATVYRASLEPPADEDAPPLP